MSGPDIFTVVSVSHDDMAEIFCNDEPYVPQCNPDDTFVRKDDYDRMEARIRELTESATRLIVAMRRDSWPGHDHSYVRELGHILGHG